MIKLLLPLFMFITASSAYAHNTTLPYLKALKSAQIAEQDLSKKIDLLDQEKEVYTFKLKN